MKSEKTKVCINLITNNLIYLALLFFYIFKYKNCNKNYYTYNINDFKKKATNGIVWLRE